MEKIEPPPPKTRISSKLTIVLQFFLPAEGWLEEGKTVGFETLRPVLLTHYLPAPAIFPIFRGVARVERPIGIVTLASNTNNLKHLDVWFVVANTKLGITLGCMDCCI